MVLDFTPQRCLNYKRRRLQQVMLEFRDKLPQTMAFNIENLRYADELREGYYFHFDARAGAQYGRCAPLSCLVLGESIR